MRLRARHDNLLIAALVILGASSVGIKAAHGPVEDATTVPAGQVEHQLQRTLQAQGFSASIRPAKVQSAIIYAQRGACRLSVRDARDGTAVQTVFARDAANIGPVRYLYRGQSSASAPALAMRVDRLKTDFLSTIGVATGTSIPVALATSPGCNGQDFGLENVGA